MSRKSSPTRDKLIAYFKERDNAWATVLRIALDLEMKPGNVTNCMVAGSIFFKRRKTDLSNAYEYQLRDEEDFKYDGIAPATRELLENEPKPALSFKPHPPSKGNGPFGFAVVRLAPLVYTAYEELQPTIKRICADQCLLVSPGVGGEFLLHDVLGIVKLRVKGATITNGTIKEETGRAGSSQVG